MLSNEEIIKRLYEQPDKFMKAMSRKEYANAAFTAYIAECVCLFCDVPRNVRTELFGDRQVKGRRSGKSARSGFEGKIYKSDKAFE